MLLYATWSVRDLGPRDDITIGIEKAAGYRNQRLSFTGNNAGVSRLSPLRPFIYPHPIFRLIVYTISSMRDSAGSSNSASVTSRSGMMSYHSTPT